jgi:hypothetical protein
VACCTDCLPKQGVLRPQAVPLILQDTDVLQVVKGSHYGWKYWKYDESKPDRAVPQLHPLRAKRSKKHGSHLLPYKQRAAYHIDRTEHYR